MTAAPQIAPSEVDASPPQAAPHPDGDAGGPTRLGPGRTVPGTRYRILRWLGEGGMGVVYEVEHLDIERRAAMKILRTSRDTNPELADQFRREARSVSKIGSPYIVEIFDFGALPDGRLMFTMELLDGHGLVDELDAAPMSISRLFPILRQMCKGLAAAHDAGVVHRDIKPENVLLVTEPDGRADRVKIVDFGIARIMEGKRVREQDAAGSPHYMAPELCLGLDYGPAVDIYALGCTAYELLCGHPPFEGERVTDVLRGHISEEPPPPSTRTREPVPPPLEEVILRCLGKQARERYADMRDLEAALCEAQLACGLETPWDDLPLPEVDPERREHLRPLQPTPEVIVATAETPARMRWLLAGALTVGAVGLGAAFFWPRPAPTDHASDPVDLAVRAAKDAAARAHYVYPPADDPAADTAYRVVLGLEGGEVGDPDRAAHAATALREEFAQTLTRLGDRYWELPAGKPFAAEFYAQALFFDPDDAHAQQRVGLTPLQLAALRDQAARGEFSEAELRSLSVLEPLSHEPPERALQALADQAASDTPRSLRHAGMVRDLLEANGVRAAGAKSRPAPSAPGASDEPATSGEPPEAEPDPEPAAPQTARRGDAAAARARVREGQSALRAGHFAQAERAFHRALAADPGAHAAMAGLSDVAFERGAYEVAAKWARKAVRRAPRRAAYRIRLGDAYLRVLRYRDAQTQYEKARALGSPVADKRLARLHAKTGG